MSRRLVLCGAVLFLDCGLVREEPILGPPDSSPNAMGAAVAATDAPSPTTTADATGTLGTSAVGTDAGTGVTVPDGNRTDSAGPDATTSSPCTPGATQCVGNGVQTCGADGQWGAPAACPVAMPFCNGPGLCGVCPDGATQCLFNGAQTCAAGMWGDVVACPSTTPNCVAGVCGQPPSCQVSAPGTTNCGAGGSGTESCCASPEVPGGTYYRTYDLGADGGAILSADGGPAGEADPATVSGFRLDKYLVTVGRFRQWGNYVTDGGAGPEAGSGKHVHLNGGQGLQAYEAPDPVLATPVPYESGWIASAWPTEFSSTFPNYGAALASCATDATWTPLPGSSENLPMTCVTWSEAYAFCIWDGGFLPSDAEWGYAAAGGSQQREYPWGSTDPGTGNQYAIFCAIGAECAASGDDAGASWAPVGTAALGAGRWGQLDLAGEAAEWVLDLSGEPWTSALVNPCTDCASLDWIDNGPYPGDANRYPGPFRVTRTDGSGGVPLLSTYRSYDDPEWMEYSPTPPKRRGGFRCARTP